MLRAASVLGLLVLAACGGSKKATPDGAAGSAGADAAGTAGSSGAPGDAGTVDVAGTMGGGGTSVAGGGGTGVAGGGGTGVAGRGGTGAAGVGVAGASGGGGTGASGGTSGAAGTRSGAECRTADDCMLASDCCACSAEPKGTPADSCPAICKVDMCTAIGIQQHEVTCAFGRCVLARSCVTTRVTCPADPAACPAGTVHSVLDDCWGPCLPPTECSAVMDCGSCGAGSVCVRNEELRGQIIGCVTPAPDCRAGGYCQCLAACSVGCAETDAGVGCFCPGC